MPLFEFRCSGCGKRFSQLIGMTADSSDPHCPKCGSTRANKLISRFSRVRSEDERLDSLEDAAFAGGAEDPASMRKLMKEMGSELEDEGGEDFDELMDEAERELYDGEGEADAS